MADSVLNAAGTGLHTLNEAQRQALGAFYFGMLTVETMNTGKTHTDLLGAQIGNLCLKFGYDEATAVEFAHYLTQCSAPGFNPAVKIIIHRGGEGYLQLEENKEKEFKKNVQEALDIIKRWS